MDIQHGVALNRHICQITGISVAVLQDFGASRTMTVEARLAWMANRKTAQEEDMSYCLLGIFGVTMPTVYGEKYMKARRRLLAEIGNAGAEVNVSVGDRQTIALKSAVASPFQYRRPRSKSPNDIGASERIRTKRAPTTSYFNSSIAPITTGTTQLDATAPTFSPFTLPVSSTPTLTYHYGNSSTPTLTFHYGNSSIPVVSYCDGGLSVPVVPYLYGTYPEPLEEPTLPVYDFLDTCPFEPPVTGRTYSCAYEIPSDVMYNQTHYAQSSDHRHITIGNDALLASPCTPTADANALESAKGKSKGLMVERERSERRAPMFSAIAEMARRGDYPRLGPDGKHIWSWTEEDSTYSPQYPLDSIR
jgi:hypothetical protein